MQLTHLFKVQLQILLLIASLNYITNVGRSVGVVLAVHDSLLAEYRSADVHRMSGEIREVMEAMPNEKLGWDDIPFTSRNTNRTKMGVDVTARLHKQQYEELHAEAVQQENDNMALPPLPDEMEEYIAPAVVDKVITILLLDFLEKAQREMDHRALRTVSRAKQRAPKEMKWDE